MASSELDPGHLAEALGVHQQFQFTQTQNYGKPDFALESRNSVAIYYSLLFF